MANKRDLWEKEEEEAGGIGERERDHVFPPPPASLFSSLFLNIIPSLRNPSRKGGDFVYPLRFVLS